MDLKFFESHMPLFGAEIKRWQQFPSPITLWWRDDDAAYSTASLQKLLDVHQQYHIPLALAVIPEQLQMNAVDLIIKYPGVEVIQHGIQHQNHARPGAKKLELGGYLETQEALDGLEAGLYKLRQCFGNQFVPVLVPPWNRIREDIAEKLHTIGFLGLSEHQRRKPSPVFPNLIQNNTHCDPVRWRRQRHARHRFVGWPAIDRFISWHLSARRRKRCRSAEATGLLTHHLDFGSDIWKFLDVFLSKMSNVPVVTWQKSSEVFDQDSVEKEIKYE